MTTTFVGHFLGPDVHASRPSASGLPEGTLYVCTTHNKIERVFSGAWTDYADLGAGGGGGGATGATGPVGATGATGAGGGGGGGAAGKVRLTTGTTTIGSTSVITVTFSTASGDSLFDISETGYSPVALADGLYHLAATVLPASDLTAGEGYMARIDVDIEGVNLSTENAVVATTDDLRPSLAVDVSWPLAAGMKWKLAISNTGTDDFDASAQVLATAGGAGGGGGGSFVPLGNPDTAEWEVNTADYVIDGQAAAVFVTTDPFSPLFATATAVSSGGPGGPNPAMTWQVRPGAGIYWTPYGESDPFDRGANFYVYTSTLTFSDATSTTAPVVAIQNFDDVGAHTYWCEFDFGQPDDLMQGGINQSWGTIGLGVTLPEGSNDIGSYISSFDGDPNTASAGSISLAGWVNDLYVQHDAADMGSLLWVCRTQGVPGTAVWRKYAPPKDLEVKVIDDATVLTTGDAKIILAIPASLNGCNLVAAHAFVTTVSSSGLPTVQIRNITQTADMLTTKITIDASEFTSYSAATAPVIDTGNDDVATGDLLAVDVDVAGTGAKGLGIILTFQVP